ncbi:hypothetical protein JKF63_03289 [Porcisia hertigi]|uniref:Uncharacterized protein n=1 Tax=Porcisia hertigi TaxID=2761500 RepID=A0A836IRH3_9TRYP|nr:hypothetical protein JKF63_03289 [Porcisia hertigi]
MQRLSKHRAFSLASHRATVSVAADTRVSSPDVARPVLDGTMGMWCYSGTNAFSGSLWHPCAFYSTQSSKAASLAKAAAALSPVAKPGSAAAMPAASPPSSEAAASKSTGRTGKSRGASWRGRKGGSGSEGPQDQAPRKRAGRRRRISAAAETVVSSARVKPMRSRRKSDPPRRRATPKQEATRLLQSLDDRALDVSAASASRICNSTSSEGDKDLEQGTLAAATPVKTQDTRPVPPLQRPAATARAVKVDTASLSTAKLLQRLQLTSFVERVAGRVKAWTSFIAKWAQPTSDPAQREWERRLLLSLRKDSFSDCTDVQQAMQERYEDQFGHNRDDVAFLTLYARVLVNNAMFCLTSCETYRTTQLLCEALRVAKEAYVLQRPLAEGEGPEGDSSTTVARKKMVHARTGTRTAAAVADASEQHTVVGDPECHLLLLRVLLANAYASDQQYWKAAEQYQLVSSTMERNPVWYPDQVAPGLASPLPFNPTFVTEDAKLFYEDKLRVDHAISQGRAQLLLLQSKGSAVKSTRLLQVQLAMARLHRHAGQYVESQNLYERYLDGVTEHLESEDVGGVMLEIGRLLLYKLKSDDAAVVYLEAAAGILLEDAEGLLQAADTESDDAGRGCSGGATSAEARIAAGNAAHRAAGGLIDAAMAFHAVGKTGKAIGLLEGCLRLLDRAGLSVISAWARKQYADMLVTVALVDRALEEYSSAIELLRNSCSDAVAHLGTAGEMVPLHAAEVEGHLAFCLQNYVGDHKRAMKHYRNIVNGSHKKDSSVTSAQVRLNKRARRQRAAAAAAATAGSATNSMFASDGVTFTGDQGRVGSSTAVPRVDRLLPPHVLLWVLSNYVACCERVGSYEEAIGVQNRLIEIEGALGGVVVDSYLKLISLARQAGDVEKTLALCFYVFFLPEGMMSSEMRLSVANSFAFSCHRLGNTRMGSVLLQAVQQVCGDHDATSLVRYALGLRALDPSDRVQLEGIDIKASIESIGRVFRRAASIVVTDMVVSDAENEEWVAGDDCSAPSSTGSSTEALPSDNGDEFPVSLSTSLSGRSRERLKRALNGLIVLSRGAFFFHQNRFMKDAEDLYAAALQHVDHIIASMPVLTDKYQREMGILLVNYATLKSATDPELAAHLYERAAAVCPTYLEVAEVVADVFVQAGDYAKGSVYMKRVMQANPSAAVEMHMRLARLGTGAAWETMGPSQRMEVLAHLLKGLGIAPKRIAAAFAARENAEELKVSEPKTTLALGELAPLLLDGVATAASEDAVCFATYVVQTRLQEPQLLNRMYRRALLRFPQHATILVNYATLCMYSGYHTLARKYIAKAYAASSGDLNCTISYAHYLCRSFEDRQVGCGESLYDRFLGLYPNVAQAHAAFANYMAGCMPTPFKTEHHFQKALALAPKSEDVVLQYGQFMWACTDSRTVYTNEDVRRRVFDRVEQLFKDAVAINPGSFTACHQLGTFYANRQNRFEDAMKLLQQAHRLQPGNVEVMRHILSCLHGECARMQNEKLRRGSAVASQGTGVQSFSGRLRSLVDATKDMFEHVLKLDPDDKATLENYARFAVETLQDPKLAASIYRRIEELNRKYDGR